MTFRINDRLYPQRSYMFDGKFISFQDYHADVPPGVAYRMSRISPSEDFEIPLQPPIPYDPDTWKKEKRIIWSCNIASASGFGSVTENVILSLLRQGVKVQNPGSISTDIIHGGEHVDEGVKASLNHAIEPNCLEIQYCQPPAIKTDVVQRIWTYAMFETDHTPKLWIEKLNKVERILVPSSWLVDSWREQGVTVPISVFHHGVDPEIYSYMDRPLTRKKYTFLQFGELDTRKGTDVVFRAFADEFKGEKDVQLILKTNRAGVKEVPFEHPNVLILHRSLYPEAQIQQAIKTSDRPVVIVRASVFSKKQMRDLLFETDCFVFPTRGEGFGLTPLEAMATGLPTIVTDWSGPVDYSDPKDTMIVGHTMTRSYDFDIIYKGHFDRKTRENSGYWAEPNYEEVRKWMRWAYENRAKAKDMGRRAAERIAREWTWDIKVKELINLFNKYL